MRRHKQLAKVRPLVVQSFEDVPLRCGHTATGNPTVDYPRRLWWCDTCRAYKARKS
jgi:hypothetical protein